MSKNSFRSLLIAQWVLVLASYAVSMLDAGAPLAAELVASGAGPGATLSPPAALLYWLLYYLYFITFLVSTVALFAFRRWAPALYAAYYALGLALALVPPYATYSRGEAFVGGLFSLATVLTLTLIFFSPVREYFRGGAAGQLR